MGIIGIVLFFFSATLLGMAIVQVSRLSLNSVAQLLVSLCVGVVAETMVLFGLGLVGFFQPLPMVIVLDALAFASLVILKKEALLDNKRFFDILNNIRKDSRFRKNDKRVLVSYVRDCFIARSSLLAMTLTISLILFVIWFFGRSLFFDPSGGLVAGDRLVWVDWPIHITIASSFAHGNNFFPQNPTFAGIGLIYPFFSDFLSGVFLKLGASYPQAFIFPGIILTLLFCFLFVRLVMELMQPAIADKKLVLWSFIALFLCLFWGGLGWVYWLGDVFKTGFDLSNFIFPPHEYTFWAEKNLWFFTFLYSEILPQRAFLFGLPMFFLVLLLFKKGWEAKQIRYLAFAGAFTGVMPFFHTHSFLSLVFLIGTFFGIKIVSARFTKAETFSQIFTNSLAFFIPLLILFLPQLPLFLSQSHGLPFEFGWMKGKENLFLFWFKNTGLFWPLWILGFWRGKWSAFAKTLGLASLILFILPNLFRFAPWGYDNLKILTYWYLLGSVFVVGGLIEIRKTKFVGPILVMFLILSLTLSGVLEISRIAQTSQTQIGLWSAADQELAAQIKQKTSAESIFLTASIHDHPVAALAGRMIVIGFPGNSWSWGIDGWEEREADVRTMFRGGPEALRLWKKYRIDYIIVTDRERWFEKKLDEEFIADHTQLVIEAGSAKLYKVK